MNKNPAQFRYFHSWKSPKFQKRLVTKTGQFEVKPFRVCPLLLCESIVLQLINDEADNSEANGETFATGLFKTYENILPVS